MRDEVTNRPDKPGIYRISWRFPGNEVVRLGIAEWTGNIWIARDAPGGVIVLDWMEITK